MKDLKKIKDSIEKFNQSSIKEKDSLIDSIEMLWLNAGIQKKKKDIKLKSDADENITRIRQLLAAAWSEDLKD
jgi:5'-3' exonuclease